MTNFKPIHDRIIVKPESRETQTKSGIFIPDTHKHKPKQGVVVAAGPGRAGQKMSVKKGDAIVFADHAGFPLTHEGEEYLVLRESDVFTVL